MDGGRNLKDIKNEEEFKVGMQHEVLFDIVPSSQILGTRSSGVILCLCACMRARV